MDYIILYMVLGFISTLIIYVERVSKRDIDDLEAGILWSVGLINWPIIAFTSKLSFIYLIGVLSVIIYKYIA